MERERKLYFRINPIPRLEIDRAVTNGSAVYILLGEILCHPCSKSKFVSDKHAGRLVGFIVKILYYKGTLGGEKGLRADNDGIGEEKL